LGSKNAWAKPIFDEAGLVLFIKCHVCSRIDKKDKVLVAKWDIIQKHVGKKKTHDGKWFMDPKCGDAQNEIIYVQLSTTIVFQQINLGQIVEDKQKLIQFATIFNI
jgi:ribosomal protein S27E